MQGCTYTRSEVPIYFEQVRENSADRTDLAITIAAIRVSSFPRDPIFAPRKNLSGIFYIRTLLKYKSEKVTLIVDASLI